jgi:alpha-L-rhamnosidase
MWREGGKALAGHPDIHNLRRDGGKVSFEIGSGSYHFNND